MPFITWALWLTVGLLSKWHLLWQHVLFFKAYVVAYILFRRLWISWVLLFYHRQLVSAVCGSTSWLVMRYLWFDLLQCNQIIEKGHCLFYKLGNRFNSLGNQGKWSNPIFQWEFPGFARTFESQGVFLTFSSSLMARTAKLECLSLGNFFSAV